MEKKQETYEKPKIEIVEFEFKESIAVSGDFGPSAICSEGIYE